MVHPGSWTTLLCLSLENQDGNIFLVDFVLTAFPHLLTSVLLKSVETKSSFYWEFQLCHLFHSRSLTNLEKRFKTYFLEDSFSAPQISLLLTAKLAIVWSWVLWAPIAASRNLFLTLESHNLWIRHCQPYTEQLLPIHIPLNECCNMEMLS